MRRCARFPTTNERCGGAQNFTEPDGVARVQAAACRNVDPTTMPPSDRPLPTDARPMKRRPDVSFVMPCYNEQEAIPYTIPQLLQAFEKVGVFVELVACDNGSRDRTGDIIRGFAAQGLSVVYHRVDINEGYGNGILSAMPVCTAPWVGVIPADGQVDAEDVVRLFEVVRHSDGLVVGKVRRRFRMDGFLRKIVSILYNAFVWMLWPRLGSIDINGLPKIIHRDVLSAMQLESKRWFLDPEIMIKAHYLGVRVIEMNVFARMRANGLSHVRASTCLEFFVSLLRFKFGGGLAAWRKSHPSVERRRMPVS
jgi:glycosyltransferase involved in cell wall biosynthesis